ncbi:MAG: HD domain-containing protein [Erysipelotrichaceae bacterium]
MQEQQIIEFYCLCNRLKNLLRTGWLDVNIKQDRIESVAEHIYSTQMLAIAMYSQFEYKIDLQKVIFMLAIHEIEEIIIGDLTYKQIDEKTKLQIGHQAVLQVLKDLNMKDYFTDLIYEFDAKQSSESKFAYYCDKLECDLQCKLYSEKEDNEALAQQWLTNDLNKIGYDNNFTSVLLYALNNKINKY